MAIQKQQQPQQKSEVVKSTALPTEGGSYVRDPITGDLTRIVHPTCPPDYKRDAQGTPHPKANQGDA